MLRIVFLLVLVICFCEKSSAQKKYSVEVESYGMVSTNELVPLWLHANEWGKYQQYGQTSGGMILKGSYELLNKKKYTAEFGLAGVGQTGELNQAFLHEAYVKGNLWFVDYSLGKDAESWVAYNDKLTTGSFLMSSNARPIPKIRLGIKEYKMVSFTKGLLEVKGGISQGVLNDNRGEMKYSVSDVLVHEKFAFVRFKLWQIKPYAGLIHSAFFGGIRSDGYVNCIDFWPTFWATGSKKLGGAELTNAAGAHMGLWDFGVNADFSFGEIQIYYQKPFADASGMKFLKYYNPDFILGLIFQPQKDNWIEKISIEFVKTDFQSGYGTPDPFFDKDFGDYSKGQRLFMYYINDDLDEFMSVVYGEEKEGWNSDEVWQYLIDNTNFGYDFGGRDDYMNNTFYYKGWTYHDRVMGSPLFHTNRMSNLYSLNSELSEVVYITNNRVIAMNVGISGRMSNRLRFRIKGTVSENFGSYSHEFKSRDNWERVEDYFFETAKDQWYLLGEVSWKCNTQIKINSSIGLDFGQLYDSFGCRFGITYSPFKDSF